MRIRFIRGQCPALAKEFARAAAAGGSVTLGWEGSLCDGTLGGLWGRSGGTPVAGRGDLFPVMVTASARREVLDFLVFTKSTLQGVTWNCGCIPGRPVGQVAAARPCGACSGWRRARRVMVGIVAADLREGG